MKNRTPIASNRIFNIFDRGDFVHGNQEKVLEKNGLGIIMDQFVLYEYWFLYLTGVILINLTFSANKSLKSVSPHPISDKFGEEVSNELCWGIDMENLLIEDIKLKSST